MAQKNAFNDLILSFAAVATFLGAEHFLVSNGYTNFAWLIGLLGIIFLFWSDKFDRAIPTELINKKIILAISHVFIFISLKIYLDPFLGTYWWVVFLAGLILLNKSYVIANWLNKNGKK